MESASPLLNQKPRRTTVRVQGEKRRNEKHQTEHGSECTATGSKQVDNLRARCIMKGRTRGGAGDEN